MELPSSPTQTPSFPFYCLHIDHNFSTLWILFLFMTVEIAPKRRSRISFPLNLAIQYSNIKDAESWSCVCAYGLLLLGYIRILTWSFFPCCTWLKPCHLLTNRMMRRAFGHSLTGSHFVLEGWAFLWWTCKSQSQLPCSSPCDIKPCLSRCACLRLLTMSWQCKHALGCFYLQIFSVLFYIFKGYLFWYKINLYNLFIIALLWNSLQISFPLVLFFSLPFLSLLSLCMVLWLNMIPDGALSL